MQTEMSCHALRFEVNMALVLWHERCVLSAVLRKGRGDCDRSYYWKQLKKCNDMKFSESLKASPMNKNEWNEYEILQVEHQRWKQTLRLSGSSGKIGKWKEGENVLQSCTGGRLPGYARYAGRIDWLGSWKHRKKYLLLIWPTESRWFEDFKLGSREWHESTKPSSGVLVFGSWHQGPCFQCRHFRQACIFLRLRCAWKATPTNLLILFLVGWQFKILKRDMSGSKINRQGWYGDSRCWGIQGPVVTS